MRAEKNVPEIRFNGFSGAWLQSNLAECTDLLTGNPFNSKEFTTSGFLLVRGMNVKRGYLDTSANLSEYWPSSKGLERYLLEPEDIVIQMDGALIGKSYAKIISKNLPAILVQRVTRIRCSKVNPDLIYQYIQKDFLNHISGIKTETAVPHLSLHDIRNFPVFLPENLEQTAIGNTFQKLDKLINQHQQKQNKLSNIKKAMLEKMFPKEGEVNPEIRFKGFSGEWLERSLKEIASDITDGNWIEAEHIFDSGEYRIIQTGNIGVGQYLDRSKHAKYFHQSNFDAVRGNEIFPGDILISRLADPAGRAAILPTTGYRMVTAVDVAIVRPEPCFDSYFLMTLLNRDEALKAVREWVSGTSHKRISHANLVKVKAVVPCVEEQAAIGGYFQKLDELINQHQQQIIKLNNIKQACLSKMFV